MSVFVWNPEIQNGKNLNCLFRLLLLLRVCDSFAHAASHFETTCDSFSQGLVERCSDVCLDAIRAKNDAREREIRIKQLPWQASSLRGATECLQLQIPPMFRRTIPSYPGSFLWLSVCCFNVIALLLCVQRIFVWHAALCSHLLPLRPAAGEPPQDLKPSQSVLQWMCTHVERQQPSCHRQTLSLWCVCYK